MELHVWGYDSQISLIEPECLASAWLLQSIDAPYKIITSNNTNLSPTHSLPLLIDGEHKISGYSSISKYVTSRERKNNDENDKNENNENNNDQHTLIELALVSYIAANLRPINQYNLYIKSDNYEEYTRKLFKNYFPFPMMYNQPLKFYYGAQDLASTVGLKSLGQGFFNFNGTGGEDNVAETEMVNEDTQEEKAISSLHEKQLISKSKQRKTLSETRYTLKCLTLLEEHINHILKVYSESSRSADAHEREFEFGQFGASDMLLLAYIHSLTSKDLPNKFILNFLTTKYSRFTSKALDQIAKMNKQLDANLYKEPKSSDIPSLWNEVVYVVSQYI